MTPNARVSIRRGLLQGTGALLIATLSHGVAHAQSCEALAGTTISAARIGLASGGATITASHLAQSPKLHAEYCEVLGVIAPQDPKAHPILFQVNLPKIWNHKTLQYGGGGMNGRLVSAVSPLPNASPGPTPLEKGYATFGTDSGHPETAPPMVESLFLNPEERDNFAFAAYKKLHDVGTAIAADYYGARPGHSYFVGISEGGREALVVAQRFGADFDGVIATVPAIAWTGINLSTYNFWVLQQNGGWMGPEKVKLVEQATLDSCDGLDGAVDGLIADPQACAAKLDLHKVRCPGGKDTGDQCLSDAQIALVYAIHKSIPYAFAASQGQSSYPGFGIGGEDTSGGLVPNVIDPRQNLDPMSRFGVANARLVLTGNPALAGPLNQAQYASRLRYYSLLMDAVDPDLGAFRAHGGKLILREHGADHVISPYGAARYAASLQKKYGPATREFVRFYFAPGLDHGGNGKRSDGSAIPSRIDMLAALEQWVEDGKAPGPQIVGSYASDAVTPDATLPLCEFPTYPYFKGGDVKSAVSYVCKAP